MSLASRCVVRRVNVKCRNEESENILLYFYIEKLEISNKIENGERILENPANEFKVSRIVCM